MVACGASDLVRKMTVEVRSTTHQSLEIRDFRWGEVRGNLCDVVVAPVDLWNMCQLDGFAALGSKDVLVTTSLRPSLHRARGKTQGQDC